MTAEPCSIALETPPGCGSRLSTSSRPADERGDTAHPVRSAHGAYQEARTSTPALSDRTPKFPCSLMDSPRLFIARDEQGRRSEHARTGSPSPGPRAPTENSEDVEQTLSCSLNSAPSSLNRTLVPHTSRVPRASPRVQETEVPPEL